MNTYDISWRDNFPHDDYIGQFSGKTPGQAKAACFNYLEDCGYDDFFETVRCFKVRLIHKWRVSDLFNINNVEMFQRQRAMPFLLIGMRVEAIGKMGTVCGINSSLNLDVCIDGEHHCKNYHPYWKMKYFGSKGELIKSYYDDVKAANNE